jgi:aerotaxis receptor
MIAREGSGTVREMVGTMDQISASSQKIVDIISLIDGIAFQTNILALNAAVEAARAGEQGRGFAVVATEVRHLAQRSAAAAGDVKRLIEASAASIRAGTDFAGRAGATMGNVVDAVEDVTAIMAKISAASREQSIGIDQVNQAVVHMDQVTQQNAALVEESAAAAGTLDAQALQLSRAVSVFHVR